MYNVTDKAVKLKYSIFRKILPANAPLPPALMTIFSEKMEGKKSGANLLEDIHI